jgi:hypothetical protein
MKKRILPFTITVIALLIGYIAGTAIHPQTAKATSGLHLYRESTIIPGNQTLYGVDSGEVVGFSCTYNPQDRNDECFILSKQ